MASRGGCFRGGDLERGMVLTEPGRYTVASARADLRLRNDLAFRLHMWYCSNLTPVVVFALRP